jgi:ribosomal protein L21E
MEDVPLFRAPKRRKFAKPLLAEKSSSAPRLAQDSEHYRSDSRSSGDEQDTVQAHLRKSVKPSRLGVSFASNSRAHKDDEGQLAVVSANTTSDGLHQMTNRFVGTTGQVVDVDKHMYEIPAQCNSKSKAHFLTR